jgi:hypothetical protein
VLVSSGETHTRYQTPAATAIAIHHNCYYPATADLKGLQVADGAAAIVDEQGVQEARGVFDGESHSTSSTSSC